MGQAKHIMFWFFAFIILIIPGCNQINNRTENIDDFIFQQDDQYYFDKPTSTSLSMAVSENGYYFFSGPRNSYLYYVDKKTMKPVILCNKPDCLHTDESNPEKVNYCNAFFFSNNASLIYYDSSLYVYDRNGTSLFKVSLDGTSRQKIYTFKEPPLYAIIHRGYMYYMTNDNGTVSGKEASTFSTCGLYRISLSDMSKRPELIYQYKGIYANLCGLKGYKNYVMFTYNAYDDSLLQSAHASLLKYDINKGNTTAICQDAGRYSICCDKIVFYSIDGFTYRCNLDGSDKKLLNDVEGLSYSDGTYIFMDTKVLKQIKPNGAAMKRQLIVYTLEGKEVQSFDIEALGVNDVYGGDNHYIFIPDDNSKMNEVDEIKSLWVIDKRKIATGKAEPEKLFEFIPKVKFPGVITKTD